MDMDSILKRAQEFQQLMIKKQEELAGRTVTSTVGGGMVTVVANGRGELMSVRIDPEAGREDLEMLQDLVVAAGNDALRKARELVAQEMSRVAGGLGLPGLF